MCPTRRGLVVCVAFLAVVGSVASLALVGGAAQPVTLSASPESPTVTPGETVTVELVLSEAPDGVAGFELTVGSGDAAVAEVTEVQVPDQFGLTETESTEGGLSVRGADTDGTVEPGDTDVTVVVVTIEGVSAGETELDVRVEQVDADDGSALQPDVEPVDVTVSTDADATPTQTPSPDGDDRTPTQTPSPDGDDSSGGDSQGADDEPTASDGQAGGGGPGTQTGTPGFRAVGVVVAFVVVLLVARHRH